MMSRCYSELKQIDSFQDRFEYLRLNGRVGEDTFGSKRYLNQILYSSNRWKRLRSQIIIRDEGCDLAHSDYTIYGVIYIHHINPIYVDDILEEKTMVFDPNNLVCTSFNTHNAIHYGDQSLIQKEPVTRKPNDTCPWR